MYLKVANRVNLKCSQHTHMHTHTYMVIMCSDVLADLIVIIILQCIEYHHMVYLKFFTLYKKELL